MAGSDFFTDSEKKELLSIARMSLVECVNGRSVDTIVSENPKLQDLLGAFVTLTQHEDLRGCIGNFEPENPLWKVVRDMAMEAALHDPRFMPLQPDELDKTDIEISVLTPRVKIHGPDEVIVGKHGLYISRGWHGGTLLPQVALEWGWNREEFLSQTCIKAGLPPDIWKDPKTDIWIYTAVIFHED